MSSNDVIWISESAAIKRIRRSLRRRGERLHIARPEPRSVHCTAVSADGAEGMADQLENFARWAGVLAVNERISPPAKRGWMHYAARHRVDLVDGCQHHRYERMTANYTTQKALMAAASRAGIDDFDIVSYDPARLSFDGPCADWVR